MGKRYLNTNELSEYLGISKHALYQKVSQKRIPFVKIGRLKFDIREIEKWIKDHSVEPKQEGISNSKNTEYLGGK
jgi:excisionase family DNA binding protein